MFNFLRKILAFKHATFHIQTRWHAFKMKKIFRLLIPLLIISCQNRKVEIQGVWYTSDTTRSDRHYYEAHITDSVFLVVDDVQLSYISTYELKGDTLTQYIRDSQNEHVILDTVRFFLTVRQDSMKLVNATNPKKSSSWTKVSNLESFDFFKSNSLEQFAIDLKKRYRKNYLDIYEPQNVETHLKDFDVYWIKEK